MFLLVITFIISMLDLLLKPLLGILKQRSGTDDEIGIIDAELKNLSEQDDFDAVFYRRDQTSVHNFFIWRPSYNFKA